MVGFLKILLGWARPYRGRLVLGILFGVLCGLTNPALMVALKIVVRMVFPPETLPPDAQLEQAPEFVKSGVSNLESLVPVDIASENTILLVLAISLIPLVMLLRGVFQFLNTYLLKWVAFRTIIDLRSRLFIHLMNLSQGFLHRTSTGELISRITNDTTAIRSTLSNAIPVWVRDPVTVISLLALLLTQHPRLTLITLVLFPVWIIPITIYNRKIRKSSKAVQTHFAQLTGQMHEAFTGNRVVKAYNLEGIVLDQFEDTSRRFMKENMRVVRARLIPASLIEFMGAVGVGMVLYFIALQNEKEIRPEDFLQFVGSVFLMYQPIKALIRAYALLVQAQAASKRVIELLTTQSTVRDPVEPRPLRSTGKPIELDNVQFAYDSKPILRDIQLTMEPGNLVALVGSSGSGKTTLTNLLLRFYDPQKGTVRIGGTDLREVALSDLRRQIAVVTQETILFNDTIRNNIAHGRPEAHDSEIEAAARKAHAHEFILEKRDGYETIIGEKGVALSGGQRQRLAIARAILKDAPILVLDEATSALDSESERVVQTALEELMQGRTTISIAHRLSTIHKADLIVVLDEGRIVEKGTHPELLQRGGVYQKLHALQFQDLPENRT